MLSFLRGDGVPESPNRQVSVRAAGGRAGSGVVDVRHQGVGRGPDHGLEVDAGVRQGRDGQRPLPAESGRQSGAGEPGHCGHKGRWLGCSDSRFLKAPSAGQTQPSIGDKQLVGIPTLTLFIETPLVHHDSGLPVGDTLVYKTTATLSSKPGCQGWYP